MMLVIYSMCCLASFLMIFMLFIFFFKQKTAYEMRISDWSSDVCSSDLPRLTGVPARVQYPPPATAIVRRDRDRTRARAARRPWRAAGMGQSRAAAAVAIVRAAVDHRHGEIGRASCRERVWTYV